MCAGSSPRLTELMELIIGNVASLTNAALLKMDPAGSGGKTYQIPEHTILFSLTASVTRYSPLCFLALYVRVKTCVSPDVCIFKSVPL